MPFWILTAAIIVLIGGFAFIAFRAGRGRRDTGGDVWIGGDLSSSDRDDSSAWIAPGDSGSGGGGDFTGGGGDFGGGGASGDWDSGNSDSGDSGGDSGGGDSGGGDGGGGDGGGGGD